MRAVVAYRGEGEGSGALLLGSALRRTTGADLSVVAVVPRVSFTGEDRADKEYRDYLDSVVEHARASAASALSPEDPAALDFERVTATSVAAGLAEAAARKHADVLVLGCARDASASTFIVGSVGERLLHSSPVPLLLAPHSYSIAPDTAFSRMTCAYVATDRSREALRAGCDLAARFGLALRVVTFVPRAEAMYPPEVGIDVEDMVAAQFAEQAVAMHEEAVAIARELGVTDVETVVARGRGWPGALNAIPWTDEDVLVFGSSRRGQLARVFLGSTASKIMRHTPVPVLIIPSGTARWVDRAAPPAAAAQP